VSALELRPRTGTEIVDASFQLYRRHFRALLTVNAIVYAPYVILEYIFRGELYGDVAPSAALLLVPLVGLMIGSFSEAAIVLAVSNSYLQGEPDPTAALRGTLRRFGTILIAVFLKYLLIGLSMIVGLFVIMFPLVFLLIAVRGVIPADDLVLAGALGLLAGVIALLGALPIVLYVFARYFAVPATVILEGLGVGAGLGRSADLSKDFKRKVCGTLALPYVLLIIIQLTVMFVAEQLPGPAILSFLVTQLPSLVLTPILAVIATLLYYDARIRKEGFDIEVMAAELGSADSSNSSPQLPVSH
jgi:hypothetical protein